MDYLKELCSKNGIHLIYNENKTILLSTGCYKNRPSIRAHKIFKGCPADVARSIANYYIYMTDADISSVKIEEYVNKVYNSKYIIKKPSKQFMELVLKAWKSTGCRESEIELEITSILHKKPDGECTKINPDQYICIENEQLIELDITVDST